MGNRCVQLRQRTLGAPIPTLRLASTFLISNIAPLNSILALSSASTIASPHASLSAESVLC